ncbi:uncharacterized protein BDZ99DRAFT_418852 [Mytilinidion resinicola]
MAPHGHLGNAENSMTRDFEDFNTPLKDAPIISLRALENGNDLFHAKDSAISIWRRLLMTLRGRRGNARRRAPELDSPASPTVHVKVVRRSSRAKWRRRSCWGCIAIPVLALLFFGMVHVANVIMSLVPMIWDNAVDTDLFLPNWGKPNSPGEGLSSYPTDFTRDVRPIPCHSHNDYWRRVPLYLALHYGCTGVEADVWLFDDDLFVGHNTASLSLNRTFRNLYVNPLVEILDRANPSTAFTSADPSLTDTLNGVFDEDPTQNLVLLVDFKNAGDALWPVVSAQLSALREKNYLSWTDGSTVYPGPITVVATGNAPFDLLTSNTTYRDIFFDAPLAAMYEEPFSSDRPYHAHPPHDHDHNYDHSEATPPLPQLATPRRDSGQGETGLVPGSSFDTTNSYYASTNFRSAIGFVWGNRLSHRQIELIRGMVAGAKSRGLVARFWNTPAWPIGVRNHVWRVLVREGAGMLSVDDVEAAGRGNWGRRKHWGWL